MGRVVATMRVVNRGADVLDLRMNLDANPAAGFAGAAFQTRVEAGVHTTTEVVLGGLLGATVTAAVFQVLS